MTRIAVHRARAQAAAFGQVSRRVKSQVWGRAHVAMTAKVKNSR